MRKIILTLTTLLAALLTRGETIQPGLDDEAREPPHRVRLTVGEQTFELTAGETLHVDGLPTLRVDVLDVRRFEAARAFFFDYPASHRAIGAGVENGGHWTFGGPGFSICLQRHREDPATTMAQYEASCLKIDSRRARSSTLVLDGRTLEGRAVDIHLGGFHAPDIEAVLEIYGFSAGGWSWLLTLQRDLELIHSTVDVPNEGHVESIEVPLWREPETTTAAVERWRQSFHFVE